MRANLEDSDINSCKLRMAASAIENAHLTLSTENAVLGMMMRIWYYAVNDQKQLISVKDISRYLLTADYDYIKKVADCLVLAEYLETQPDGTYLVLGKDKDFAQKKFYDEMSKINNKAKKLKALNRAKQKLAAQKAVKKRINTDKLPCTVPSTAPSTVASTGPHYISDHDITNQIKTTTDPTTSVTTETDAEIIHLPTAAGDGSVKVKNSAKEPQTPKSSEISTITEKPTQVIKKRWFELYRQNYGNSEYPQWGARHNSSATKLLREVTGGLPSILETMERYFAWRKKNVVTAGATFCEGYTSFCYSYVNVLNDYVKPERHLEATAEDSLWQRRRLKEEQDTLEAAMRLIEQEAVHGPKAAGF